MSDKAFADHVTIVESEWIAPQACIIVDKMASLDGEMWVRVRFMDDSEQIIKFKHPMDVGVWPHE